MSVAAMSPSSRQYAAVRRQRARLQAVVAGFVVFIASIALSAPPIMFVHEMREPNVYSHVMWAENLGLGVGYVPGHFIYHGLTALVHAVLPISWLQASVVVLLGARGLLAVVIWAILRRALPQPTAVAGDAVAVILALALTVAGGISFLSWNQGGWGYLTYLQGSIYVSQTFVVMQPLALIGFVLALAVMLARPPAPSAGLVLALAAVLLVGTLAKPSFGMALLPAAGLFLLLRGDLLTFDRSADGRRSLARGRWLRDLRSPLILVGGMVVPVVAAVVWIYVSTYLAWQQTAAAGDPGGSGIAIRPFLVMAYLQGLIGGENGVAAWMAAKFLLSILFPLATAILFFHRARHDSRLQLAWLLLAAGITFTYFFAEVPEFRAANYVWSGHIAIFILFVVSTAFLLEQGLGRSGPGLGRARPLAVAACWILLLLHVVAGYGAYTHPWVN